MKALIVPGEPRWRPDLFGMLEREGFGPSDAIDVEDAVSLAMHDDYDLALIEGDDALSAVRAFRAAGSRLPLLVLARTDISRRVRLFGAGADDVADRDVVAEELVARVQALVRRSHGQIANVIEIGDLSIDLGAKVARIAGAPIHLTGREYQMMQLLALRKGSTLTKEQFIDHLYAGRDEPELKIIDVFICKLRNRIKTARNAYIETVWGRGYRLLEGSPIPKALKYAEPGPKPLTLQEIALLRLLEGECDTLAMSQLLNKPMSSTKPVMFYARKRGLARLVSSQVGRGGYSVYQITPAGRHFLVERGFAEAAAA